MHPYNMHEWTKNEQKTNKEVDPKAVKYYCPALWQQPTCMQSYWELHRIALTDLNDLHTMAD